MPAGTPRPSRALRIVAPRAIPTEPRSCLEAHAHAATLYVSGPLTAAGALNALRVCEGLPASVLELRVDLRAARLTDATPVQAVAMLLVRWRRAHPGRRSRIELPPVSQRPMVRPLPPKSGRTSRRAPYTVLRA